MTVMHNSITVHLINNAIVHSYMCPVQLIVFSSYLSSHDLLLHYVSMCCMSYNQVYTCLVQFSYYTVTTYAPLEAQPELNIVVCQRVPNLIRISARSFQVA